MCAGMQGSQRAHWHKEQNEYITVKQGSLGYWMGNEEEKKVVQAGGKVLFEKGEMDSWGSGIPTHAARCITYESLCLHHVHHDHHPHCHLSVHSITCFHYVCVLCTMMACLRVQAVTP
jgi:hypothetical protein